MKGDAHRQAAEDYEAVLPDLTNSPAGPRTNRLIIQRYWFAAFEWIAYGCQQKYGKHKEKHNGLVKFLQDMGVPQIAKHWLDLENVRIGGVYGHQHEDSDVLEGRRLWQERGGDPSRFLAR